MGALAPVLAPSTAGERRCLTVFFEPIDGRRADRIVGGEQLSTELTAQLRARAGFRIRAAQRRDADRDLRAGHPPGRRQRPDPGRRRGRGHRRRRHVDQPTPDAA